MKKMILVTGRASPEILAKYYLDQNLVGLEGGINIVREAGGKLLFALSSFKEIDLESLLKFLPKERILRYEDEGYEKTMAKVIDFLFARGTEQIVILDKLGEDITHTHALLRIMAKSKGNVTVHTPASYLSYYSEGVHVVARQGFEEFSLFGFPEADVSLEHVTKPIRNVHLSFTETPSLTDSILERVAVLKVQKGGVLLALSMKND